MTLYTTKAQKQVQEFHEYFNHPVAEVPTVMESERALNRNIWIGEELIEHLHSSSENHEQFRESYQKFIQGLQKAYVKSAQVEFPKNNKEKLIAQADALTDAAYFIQGSFVEIGIDAQPIFDIVQNANISKLFTDEDGNKIPKYREDGKILKSPEFQTPEPLIEEEVQRQINNSLTK